MRRLGAVFEGAGAPFLDIDLLLRSQAREGIDRIKTLLSESLDFKPSKDASFRYEKTVDGSVVQFDLLADFPRVKADVSVLKVYGTKTSLDLCLVDGAEDLNDHVETIQIPFFSIPLRIASVRAWLG